MTRDVCLECWSRMRPSLYPLEGCKTSLNPRIQHVRTIIGILFMIGTQNRFQWNACSHHFLMMKSSVASSNEYVWIAEDLPNAKPLSKNGLEKHRQKQMPKNNSHSTNTYTRTDMETTTISTDDSPKRKNLPSVAKSDMYKNQAVSQLHGYWEVQVWESVSVCSWQEGVGEILVVCWSNLWVTSRHHMWLLIENNKPLKREMDNSQSFCWQEWPLSQRMRTYH